jgi:diguanylate cyclase (GGDEF)-like protein
VSAEDALVALAEALLAHEQDAFVVLRALRDEGGTVVDFVHELVNATAERNAGQPLQGRRQLEVYPSGSPSFFEALRDVLMTGQSLHMELEVSADGDPATAGRSYDFYALPVEGDRVVCQYRDITELHATQQALQEQALQDPLTGLPNRRLLLDHAELALARLPRHQGVVALLFCDLDSFKAVNDTLGHPAGDALLREVAGRLRGAVRPEDTVARFGGDEFVVLCEGALGDIGPLAMAERIRDAVIGRYDVRGTPVSVGMSVGVATTERLVPVERLLAEADTAVYQAKRRPGRPVVVRGDLGESGPPDVDGG